MNGKEKKRLRFPLQRKFALGFALLIAVLCATLGFVTNIGFRQSLEEECVWAGNALAYTIARGLRGEDVLRYADTLEKDAGWYNQFDAFHAIMKREGISYVYVVIPGDEGITYVWDVPREGETPAELGQFEKYWNEAEQLGFEVLATGQTIDHFVITNTPAFGYIASCYAPIFDADGMPVALVGVDLSMDFIDDHVLRYTISMVILTTAIVLLFLLMYLLYVSRRVVKPLRSLTDSVSAFAEDDSHLTYLPTKMRTGDEIEALGGSFDKMVGDIKRYIDNLQRVTSEKERISAELNVARTIQSGMLPRIFPPFPDRSEFDVFASMNPAREVGGDFYDLFMVDHDHVAFVVADVSGKGIPAALFMVIAKTLIKNGVQSGGAPAEVFTRVNAQLCESNDAGMFVTALLMVLDIHTGAVSIANAGHNPPLLCRADGTFEYLRLKPGLFLAGMPGVRYRAFEEALMPGDRVFLYTDGVTEAMNPAQELYGEKRLRDHLNASRGQKVTELVRGTGDALTAFADVAEQADDITMLAFAFYGD